MVLGQGAFVTAYRLVYRALEDSLQSDLPRAPDYRSHVVLTSCGPLYKWSRLKKQRLWC